MKKSLYLFLLLICNRGVSQIDTCSIINEINSLKNDSLVNVYWQKLDSCDQSVNTFSQPITQIENLIKCCYFFKIFGFSEYNRFDKGSISYSDAEMHAKIIWMHSTFADLNFKTFPMIIECFKVDKNFDYPNYFLQNIQIIRSEEAVDLNQKLLAKAEENSFNNVKMQDVVEIADEYIELISEIDNVEIVGSWKLSNSQDKSNSVQYTFRIIKSKKGNYYFESLGNYFKLVKCNSNEGRFYFSNHHDNSYFEILKNGSLVNKNETGQILENYIIN